MLQNAYLFAKIGADTTENEQHFAEILTKIGNYLTGPSSSTLPVESGLLEACAELGVAPVGYSPLGLGVLSGKYPAKLAAAHGQN